MGTYTVSTYVILNCHESISFEYTVEVVECTTGLSVVATNPEDAFEYTVGDTKLTIAFASMFAITPTACSAYVSYEGVVDYGLGLEAAVKVVDAALEVFHRNSGAGTDLALE